MKHRWLPPPFFQSVRVKSVMSSTIIDYPDYPSERTKLITDGAVRAVTAVTFELLA